MFGQWFRQGNNYEPVITEESEKLIPKKRSTCFFFCKLKQHNQDLSFKTYQLDATMYKGKYLLTYEQWVEKMKNKN